MLFDTAAWHGYAKLRLHSDSTLASFEVSTTDIGRHFRLFEKDTCQAYVTKELPSEAGARVRRQVAAAQSGKKKLAGSSRVQKRKRSASPQKLPKKRIFNNRTAKTHFLGDYPWAIRYFGTTDGNSTQIVGLIFECDSRH